MSINDTQNNVLYVKVKTNNKDFGHWYINKAGKRALFRSGSTLIPNGYKLLDFRNYDNIKDFIQHELKCQHIKEIQPHLKYSFSNDVLCSYYKEHPVGHNFRKKVVHCNQPATVYLNNEKPVCFEHATNATQ